MRVFFLIPLLAFSTALPQYQQDSYGKSDCQCIESTQKIDDGVVTGEYSYQDPVGSKITVVYDLNADGTNYSEKRRVIKAYKTDAFKTTSNLITAETVVTQIVTELEPTVIGVIRSIVLQANIDLDNYGNIVDVIMARLKPVVEGAVNNALATSQYHHLSAGELIEMITTRLRPFVVEAIRKEVISIQTVTITEEQVVKQVIDQLRTTIIRIIQDVVGSSTLDVLGNQRTLVQTIILQLRPVVISSVQKALQTSAAQLNAESLINRIIIEITPLVQDGVSKEVKIKQQEIQATAQKSADTIVLLVSKELKPTIIQIISATVQAANPSDLAKYENLVQAIIAQLRPVVMNEVQKALSTSSKYQTLNARDITLRLIVELTPFIREGVQSQIKIFEAQKVEESDNVIQIVNQQLQPIVVSVIKETIQNSNQDLSEYDNLIDTIIIRLKSVIFAEVQRVLGSSSKYQSLNAQQITEKIILQLTPFVKNTVQVQIQEFQVELKAYVDGVITQVIEQLRPIVIRVIKAYLGSSGTNVNDIQGLVEIIISRLQPDLLKAVQEALATFKYHNAINAQDISQQIVIQLKPIVLTEVEKEVKQVEVKIEGNTAQKLKGQLLVNLRPMIQEIVFKVMSSVQSTNQDYIIQQVMLQLQDDYLISLIEKELRIITGGQVNFPRSEIESFLLTIRPEIRKIIIGEITLFLKQNTLSADAEAKLIASVVAELRLTIQSTVRQLLQGSGSSLSKEQIIEQILNQMTNRIIQIIKNRGFSDFGISFKTFQNSDSFNQLVAAIIGELKIIITQQIQIFSTPAPTRAPAPAPTPAPASASSSMAMVNKITAIFGDGGPNSVKVETPSYQYQYMLD